MVNAVAYCKLKFLFRKDGKGLQSVAGVFHTLGFTEEQCKSPPIPACVDLYEQGNAANSAMLRTESGWGTGRSSAGHEGSTYMGGSKVA